MKYLLDTHIIIWWLEDSPQLAAHERMVIADGSNEVFVSAASAWEIEIKRAKGLLSIPDDWKTHLEGTGFTWLDVTPWHTEYIRNLPEIHKDPFDRMLVAQAKSENLTVISHDDKVNDYFK